jgi:hypothetical protein
MALTSVKSSPKESQNQIASSLHQNDAAEKEEDELRSPQQNDRDEETHQLRSLPPRVSEETGPTTQRDEERLPGSPIEAETRPVANSARRRSIGDSSYHPLHAQSPTESEAEQAYSAPRCELEEAPAVNRRAEETSLKVANEIELAPHLPTGSLLENNAKDAPPSVFKRELNKLLKIGRGSDGKLRTYDRDGNIVLPTHFTQNRVDMEDLTQLSSLSPTQENSESAYDALLLQISVGKQPAAPADAPVEHSQGGGHMSLPSKHHSVVTDSTAQTYEENDTGHVNFNKLLARQGEASEMEDNPEMENPEMDDPVSQDASFAPRTEEPSYGSYDPQTPAAPINPFTHKGSVLKGHEMFGATQPSSIGRHMASATSSRPSPDVYNDFTSPPKRLISSPLARRNEGDFEAEQSPLQSSVRKILRSKSIDTSRAAVPHPLAGVQSFDVGTRIQLQSSAREPRPYVSMKDSQERRRQENSTPESEADSDSELDDALTRRHKERRREKRIQEELATVELHKHLTARRHAKSSSAPVEVPSTGRRRSWQDDYIAQCEGFDARDTQSGAEENTQLQETEQDEIVTDSQAVLEETAHFELSNTTASKDHFPSWANSLGSNIPDSPSLPAHTTRGAELEGVPELEPNVDSETTSSAPKGPGSPVHQASLPLQEVSTNHLRTPMASKDQVMSDGADVTVPETSPAEDRIRPMGEIASVSFADINSDDLHNVPGFTQDADFNEAIGLKPSPDPPTRRTRSKRSDAFSSFKTPAVAAESSELSNELEQRPAGEPGGQLAKSMAHETEINSGDGAYDGGSRDAQRPVHQEPVEEELRKSPEDKVKVPKKNGSRKGKKQTHLPGAGPDAAKLGEERILHPEGKSLPVVPSEQTILPSGTNNGEAGKTVDHKDIVGQPKVAAAESEIDSIEEAEATGHDAALESLPNSTQKRGGLRSKEDLKGPSRALRRPAVPTSQAVITPRQSSRNIKPTSTKPNSTKVDPTRSASAKRSTALSSRLVSVTSSALSSPPSTDASMQFTPQSSAAITERALEEETPAPTKKPSPRGRPRKAKAEPEKTSKRKSTVPTNDPVPTRSSKRQSTSNAPRDSSTDPLALPATSETTVGRVKKSVKLFSKMAFAVSYVSQQQEKDVVISLITGNGGSILEEGFDSLFQLAGQEIVLSPAAHGFGFAALIADEHSRKAKYMQALALGLPCISGRWISACVSEGKVLEWAPYLLCAGQSSFLGNAIRSRTIKPYSAVDACLPDTFANREKLLGGKSILLVTGKGKTEEKRKAYVFLTRVLGPARIEQVIDFEEARKKLLESEEQDELWDILYVDQNEHKAESAVFKSTPSGGGSKKRKRVSVDAEEMTPAPKKIRIISDEVIIQSLILGQLLSE